MKSTGIIRRIDDLGRVIIPKELRRTMHIREGDPLELFTDGDYVCFKKYNTTELFAEALDDLTDLIHTEELCSCLSKEDRDLVQHTIDFLKAKWAKEKEGQTSDNP